METEWWRSAWRLDLGEYTCKSILLLVTVASAKDVLMPLPLVVRSLDRYEMEELTVEIRFR